MVGQVIWCIAHTLWLGTSFTLLTSLGLIAHHLFARRQKDDEQLNLGKLVG
ncbi:MAG: NnrU family protein [Microcystis aeruginosa]